MVILPALIPSSKHRKDLCFPGQVDHNQISQDPLKAFMSVQMQMQLCCGSRLSNFVSILPRASLSVPAPQRCRGQCPRRLCPHPRDPRVSVHCICAHAPGTPGSVSRASVPVFPRQLPRDSQAVNRVYCDGDWLPALSPGVGFDAPSC